MDGWGYSLKGMMSMVAVGGLLITGIYFGLQRTVVKKVQTTQPAKKKKKASMGLAESFNFLARSPYIRDLATLVRPLLPCLSECPFLMLSYVAASTTECGSCGFLAECCQSAAPVGLA